MSAALHRAVLGWVETTPLEVRSMVSKRPTS